jgi:hypothetical protein
MRRIMTGAVLGLGLLGSLALPAQARPFSCSGVPSLPAAYVCLVDTKGGVNQTFQPQVVTIPAVCVALGVCTGPISQAIPIPGATIVPGWWFIVWYAGTCYYVYAPGSPTPYSTAPSATPGGCP